MAKHPPASRNEEAGRRAAQAAGEGEEQPARAERPAPLKLEAGSGRRFMATQDFFSEETKSQYCAGMFYTARHKHLDELADKWAGEGKVSFGGPAADVSGG